MVIKLRPNARPEDVEDILARLRAHGLDGRVVNGVSATTVNVIGDEVQNRDFLEDLANLPYVANFQMFSNPYKVISREAHPDFNGKIVNGSWLSKEIRAGPLVVGGYNNLALMAGPCSINADDPAVLDETAAAISELGAKGLRGGAHKPRKEPYTFRGHGLRALELGRKKADQYGLAFITEPVRTKHIDAVLEYAHVLQIGTRNATQGFYLDVAEATLKTQTPILAKRGMSQDLLDEFLPLVLNIYDYDENSGNPNVILCVRGTRTFDRSTRFTLDVGAVPVLKYESILPVVGDPSHPAGLERYVVPYAKALIAAGVDGLLVEVYPPGKKALSDAAQAISYKQLEEIVAYAKQVGRM